MTTTKPATVGASETELKQLHGAVARALLDALTRHERGEVKDQAGDPKPVPAALLQAAIKYLASNGVDRPERPPLEGDPLNDELPRFPDEPPLAPPREPPKLEDFPVFND